MNPLELPVVTFGLALLVALLIYWLGGKMAAMPLRDAKYKLKAYACGEDFPGGKVEQSYGLFHVAFLFTILHVGVLVVATAPKGDMAWLAVLTAILVGVSALVLVYRGGEQDV
jgi:NADH:ubiquinone oxidoreductase subunit 3 (subunit A)